MPERCKLIESSDVTSEQTQDDNETKEAPTSSQADTARTPWASIYIAGICSFVQSAQFTIFFSSMWPYLRKLNPQAEETEYGYIVALYSVGQCICAPSFGYWSNRIKQIRLPLLAGFVLMMAGNVLYLSLQFFSPSLVAIAMAFARFVAGCGTGNMSLLRAYSSTSSTNSDRSRAIACISGGIATGTLIGPAFQLLFTPLGPDGIYVLPFYRLNIYNSSALFSFLLNVLGFLLIIFVFEERYDVLNTATARVSVCEFHFFQEQSGLPSPCVLAILICVATRFVQIFAATSIQTVGSPFSMLMFSFNKEEAVTYNSSAHFAAGFVGVILYFVFIFFDLSKLMAPRLCSILSLLLLASLFLFTYSWPFLPNKVEISVNGSDWGCCTERFDWCDDLTMVSPWVYYTFYVLFFGTGMSVMNISVTTLYSEIVGPRRQGTLQGVFQMAGSLGRLIAPLLISALYVKFGPRIPWITQIVQISVIISLWLGFLKKMVPL
ncbi:hypothetical protein Angca_008634, partial [Angiostrongylus cantonensis]